MPKIHLKKPKQKIEARQEENRPSTNTIFLHRQDDETDHKKNEEK